MSKSKSVEYLKEKLAVLLQKKEQLSHAISVRKMTVRDQSEYLKAFKEIIAEFSRKGKSSGRIRGIRVVAIDDYNHHVNTLVSLKKMYSDNNEEIFTLQNILKQMEE